MVAEDAAMTEDPTSVPNPYNRSRPGNCFCGYERMRREILSGLQNGNSYAIVGGRRCGKTSLLLQLERDISAQPLPGFRLVPRYLDMQEIVPRSPLGFFRHLYGSLVPAADRATLTLDKGDSNPGYQQFLTALDAAGPALGRAYDEAWLVVMLVDELDVGLESLPDDECFQNLRNFFMVSRYHHRFRMIATGAGAMERLISGGGSPLNNLRPRYLQCLTNAQARQLVSRGFAEGMTLEVETLLFSLTGGHPYLLQAVLELLWAEPAQDLAALERAAEGVKRECASDFRRWCTDIGPNGLLVYKALLAAPNGTIQLNQFTEQLRDLSAGAIDEGVQALSYHGLVDDTQPDEPRAVSRLFAEWLTRQGIQDPLPQTTKLQLVPQPLAEKAVDLRGDAKKVFVVYGRNESMRLALFNFLRALGLEPLEWSKVVDATGTPTPYVGQVLETGFTMAQAAVILLTPDDEARLLEQFHAPDDPDYETQLTPQARPNVLFEAGMAMGRFPNRTILVELGRLRPFSDISGLLTVRLSDDAKHRKEFVQRLKRAGCDVDDRGVDWLRVGDFGQALEGSPANAPGT
jgi:predicted nucleotide-binding protein